MGLGKSKPAASSSTSGNPHRGSTSKGSSPPAAKGISDADRATLQLKLQRDKLQVVIRRSEKVLQRESEQAQEWLRRGDRTKALCCVKRRKLHETQLQHVTKLLDNVQHTLQTLATASLDIAVAQSLQEGTKALTALQKEFSPEEVERVMDEAFDAIAVHREINELLRQELGDAAEEQLTDDELLKELLPKENVRAMQDEELALAEALRTAALPKTQIPQPHELVVEDGNRETEKRQAVSS